MTSEQVPELYALTAEPRSVRAGACVDVIFRTRNLGAFATPPGVVTFRLGGGLTPLGATDVSVDAVAPGDDVVACVRARAPATCEDETVVSAEAELVLPGVTYRTNACAVVVRSRPLLDGEQSGTFVEPLGRDAVRVRVVVTNEGDGPAHRLRIVARVPDGCAPVGADPVVRDLPALAPGERCEAVFDARIAAPVGTIRCDGAHVECANTARVAVPVRESHALEPVPAPPQLALAVARRRVDATIVLRNDGWAEARDVRAGVMFPAALRVIDGSVAIDGVPAASAPARGTRVAPVGRVTRAPDGCAIAIASIPARTGTVVTLALATPACGARGSIAATAGGREARVPFATAAAAALRVDVVEQPASAAPGDTVRVTARVVNEGDEAVEVRCAADESAAAAPAVRIPACSFARLAVDIAIPASARDGTLLERTIVARDAGTSEARARLAVRVRAASTGVRDATAADASRAQTASAAAPAGERHMSPVRARLDAPERVPACGAFDVVLHVDADRPVERLAVRVPVPAGARYVAGSSRIDGRAVIDAPGEGDAAASPLDGPGIVLCALAGGTHVELACSFVALDPPDDATALLVPAVVDADGAALDVATPAVAVDPRPMFAARSDAMPFHVVGCALAGRWRTAAPPAAGPAAFEPPAGEDAAPAGESDATACEDDATAGEHDAPSWPASTPRTARIDAARAGEIARLHHALRGPGLVAHLFALRFFFPEAGGTPAGDAFARVRAALEDVFDRLYVKLRIPGYVVSTDDLEDASLRTAIDALFEAVGEPAQRAGDACGAPATLRALTALLIAGWPDDARLGAAVASHARALGAVLARYDGLPLEVFDDALARRGDETLDAARADLIAAMRPYVAERAAC